MDSWGGVGWYTCMLGWYTGLLLHRHAGRYTWCYMNVVCRVGTWVSWDSTQNGTKLWWDGTLQDSVNEEAKWTLENALLLPLLKLTPLLVSVADDIGFAFLLQNSVAVHSAGFGNKLPYQVLAPPVWVV